MKLDRAVLGRVATLSENSERLQDTDSAGAIVVRTRCRQEREQIVRRVLVCAKNGQRLGKVSDLRLKACDDGRLGKRVGKIF